jgi:hypothetical protein
LLRPIALAKQICGTAGPNIQQAIATGPLEERILFVLASAGGWRVAHLGGRSLSEVAWPEAIASGLSMATPSDCVSLCELSRQALFRLTRPRLSLVSLCHPEVFPLPRFPLGISDLARAVRLRRQGQVSLFDMQLGLSLRQVFESAVAEEPDIVGISATFGQHDLLVELADRFARRRNPPLLVFGGSLAALNASLLLRSYPGALVAHGPGEVTMQDVVEHWHGDRTLAEVRGACSLTPGGLLKTPGLSNREVPESLPELDLLEETLDRRGVMQLEASRGCTHACSFCPRQHKGIWAGTWPEEAAEILDAVGRVFESRPAVARKIFLVDEEFIGHDSDGDGPRRALEVAEQLSARNFRWETSSRVDQIYNPGRGKDWHVERMALWTGLRERGLDRCLFGIESGVDSILKRFNKRAMARQNALAVRLLSACGIPIRCTYITFDQLMSFEELEESYLFQGRPDLLLKPQPAMPLDELFDAIHDEGFAAEHSCGTPLYESITYLLVTMECLLGSPYLKQVEEAGLAREEVPAMGRRNADFLDPEIGTISDSSQRWVDRNFSFDYALKSLEKITTGIERTSLRRLRALLKEYAYRLLGKLLILARSSLAAPETGSSGEARSERHGLMDAHFRELVAAVESLLALERAAIQPSNLVTLKRELHGWRRRQGWPLINH